MADTFDRVEQVMAHLEGLESLGATLAVSVADRRGAADPQLPHLTKRFFKAADGVRALRNCDDQGVPLVEAFVDSLRDLASKAGFSVGWNRRNELCLSMA